jgi:hypothetical protein
MAAALFIVSIILFWIASEAPKEWKLVFGTSSFMALGLCLVSWVIARALPTHEEKTVHNREMSARTSFGECNVLSDELHQ